MDTYHAKLGNIKTIVKNTPTELTVGEVANTETDVYALNHITSTTTIADKQTLNFTAGQSITLSPGFEAKQGSNATLKIGDVPATTSKEGEEVAGVFLKEHHIYGSSRLGILAHDKLIIAENPEATNEPTGKKNYELTNHLGNVLSVISDERNGNKPDVIAFNDYYPGGMLLPNRHGSSDKYRYGFNGHEKDDEIKGEGNHYDFGLRHFDTRLARMFSNDPRENEYPWQSTYAHYANSPIKTIDYLGGGRNGEYEIDENGKRKKISDLGDDVGIDFIHQKDNSTIIEDQKTKEQITISATKDGRSLIKDYIRRDDNVNAIDIAAEFRFGYTPENSLFYGNHPLNLDIMESYDFQQTQIDFKKRTNLESKGSTSNKFGVFGVFRAGLNSTMQVLGKFDVSFYPLGDRVITLVTDSKSRNSYQPIFKVGTLWGNDDFMNHERNNPWLHNEMSNTRQSYLFVLKKSSFDIKTHCSICKMPIR